MYITLAIIAVVGLAFIGHAIWTAEHTPISED